MNKPVLLIMAAGMGSRYGGLKQIDKMTNEGEIILDFSLFDAYRAGFKKAVLIIKEEYLDDFKAILDNGAGRFLDIEYVFQDMADIPEKCVIPEGREKPWGTAHAIMSARNKINSSFAVINADDFYGENAFREMYKFLENTKSEGEFSMVAYELQNTVTESGSVSRGVCTISEEGYLDDIVERTEIVKIEDEIRFNENGEWHKLEKDTSVSMNFWGYTKGIMVELENRFLNFFNNELKENPLKAEYLIPKITDELIKEGKASCKVLKSKDSWYGVTYKEDKERVKVALKTLKEKGEYPNKLWADSK